MGGLKENLWYILDSTDAIWGKSACRYMEIHKYILFISFNTLFLQISTDKIRKPTDRFQGLFSGTIISVNTAGGFGQLM